MPLSEESTERTEQSEHAKPEKKLGVVKEKEECQSCVLVRRFIE